MMKMAAKKGISGTLIEAWMQWWLECLVGEAL
jgi:hypothetical protein